MWLLARLTPLSWADLSYVLTAFIGEFFFDERITNQRWLGTLCIVAGMIDVTRNRTAKRRARRRADAMTQWLLLAVMVGSTGTSLLIMWLLTRMTVLSWADLSYVLTVTSVGYVMTAFIGKYFFDGRITNQRCLAPCASWPAKAS